MSKKALDTENLQIVRSLNLSPQDWARATWRKREPLPKSASKYFERVEAQLYLSDVLGATVGEIKTALVRGTDGSDLPFQGVLIPMLGRNWYFRIDRDFAIALFSALDASKFIDLLGTIYKIPFSDRKSSLQYLKFTLGEDGVKRFAASPPGCSLQDAESELIKELNSRSLQVLTTLIEHFGKYVIPYLTNSEIVEMQAQLHPLLNRDERSQWSTLFVLAAYLGMHERVLKLVERLPASDWTQTAPLVCSGIDPRLLYHHQLFRQTLQAPQNLVFGLGSSAAVKAHFQRLKLKLTCGSQLKAWLAHTEYSALETIRDSIFDASEKPTIELVDAFINAVNAPEAAFYILELMLWLKQPKIAREWLENHPHNAIAGLIPIAAGCVPESKVAKTKLVEAAIEYLQVMKRKGYEKIIAAAIALQPPEIADKVKSLILDTEDMPLPPFDSQTTPQWLKNYLATKKIGWITPADLPPIVVGTHCLNLEQVDACLTALKSSTLETPAPMVKQLKANADPRSLDNFVWALFERWLEKGADSKEKWAMISLAHLGSDAIAIKLVPLIRQWPGESQHPRAVLGLDCLRVMGTNTAIMQIHGLSQTVKFRGLKTRAEECIKAIARARNLSPEQLEDRIIPTLDLELKGLPVLDFGARQFQCAIDSELKLQVRDSTGKLKANLPKPNAKDDPVKAEKAVADWKLLKKQISEVLRIQKTRLENALATERRWDVTEFESLLVRHPLMTHLVRRLIWGGFDSQNKLIGTFRVAEDGTYSDESDDTLDIQSFASVGIVHPIYLSEKQKANWGQILGDYDIIPPFDQINRQIFALSPQELASDRYSHSQYLNYPVLGQRPGWHRNSPYDNYDNGGGWECWKYFPQVNVSASVEEQGNLSHLCQFRDNRTKALLTLDRVPPLVLSEVIRDLTIMSFRSK